MSTTVNRLTIDFGTLFPTEATGGLEEEVKYLMQSSMMAGTESSKSKEAELP